LAGLAVLALACLGFALIRPSHDRDWLPNEMILPDVVFDGDVVTVNNVRNTRYRSATEYDVRYENRTYDLKTVSDVWYAVEPFGDWKGAAHTFLSFGFDDGRHLVVSVEARKEKGEAYSAWKGMLKRYELMYVIADERDVFTLRANHYGDDLFLYPLRLEREEAQALLADVLRRADALHDRPEFYNTLTSSCMTNVARHLNAIADAGIPLRSLGIIQPGYSDTLFHALGLLDTDLPADEIREHFRINDRVADDADAPDFSARIRAFDEPLPDAT
jgi:hypothetical protein